MKKWFKGKGRRLNCVDFQTSTTYYEVKGCNLLVKCNHKNREANSHQLGRFKIIRYNHDMLKRYAELDKKRMKYIFVVVFDKHFIWKTKTWEEIDRLITKDRRETRIRIKDIFEVI